MSEEMESERERVLDPESEAFIAMDDEWCLARTNDAAVRLLGNPAAELAGRSLWATMPALEGSRFEEALRNVMEGDEVFSETARLAEDDAWFELRAYPDDERLSMYLRDVTERKRRRQELEATRARFRALAGNTEQAVVTIDDDSVVRYADEAVEELFGYSSEELVGRSLLTVIPERFGDAHEAALEEYLETGEQASIGPG